VLDREGEETEGALRKNGGAYGRTGPQPLAFENEPVTEERKRRGDRTKENSEIRGEGKTQNQGLKACMVSCLWIRPKEGWGRKGFCVSDKPIEPVGGNSQGEGSRCDLRLEQEKKETIRSAGRVQGVGN